MVDPLTELEEALAYLFELQKTQGKGKYISPLVAELRRVLDNYREGLTSLSALTASLTKAYPVIINYVDSYAVKQKMAALAEAKGESFNGQQFEGKLTSTEADFISWLSLRIGKNFDSLDSEKQVQVLLTKQSEKELRVKLGVHLHVEPDFLLDLALRSLSNFIKLISSRLGFKFEKQQVAKAIHHHAKAMIDESYEPLEQVEELINFLDKRLSPKGYSIEKLLSDPLAKAELEQLEALRCAQSVVSKP